MPSERAQHQRTADSAVQLALNGGRVTAGFRAALFDHANRAGISPNEYALRAVAERLSREGAVFTGVFASGDTAAESEAA